MDNTEKKWTKLAARALRWSWLGSLFSTGLMAGVILMSAIVVTPFFNWLARDGRAYEIYGKFVEHSNGVPSLLFRASVAFQVGASLAFLLVAAWTRLIRLRRAAIAVALSVVWAAIHVGSGFDSIERLVLKTPNASAATTASYLAVNVPLHVLDLVLLSAGFFALLHLGFDQATGCPGTARRPY